MKTLKIKTLCMGSNVTFRAMNNPEKVLVFYYPDTNEISLIGALDRYEPSNNPYLVATIDLNVPKKEDVIIDMTQTNYIGFFRQTDASKNNSDGNNDREN